MSTDQVYIPLEDRGLLAISGADARTFLQGIITNDVKKLRPDQSIYACLLTPQGKFLFDFFLCEMDGKVFLDMDKERLPALVQRLTMYKLRSDVTITDVSEEYAVSALLGEKVFAEADLDRTPGRTKVFCKGIAYIDPRDPALFARSIIERNNHFQAFEAKEFFLGDEEVYTRLRIQHCVPDGTQDLIPEKSFPLHFGLDALHAIDYDKGCYVGQEVTARTTHRGVVRKTPVTVHGDGDLPEIGTPITAEEKTVGELRSRSGDIGIALIETAALDEKLRAGDVALQVTMQRKK